MNAHGEGGRGGLGGRGSAAGGGSGRQKRLLLELMISFQYWKEWNGLTTFLSRRGPPSSNLPQSQRNLPLPHHQGASCGDVGGLLYHHGGQVISLITVNLRRQQSWSSELLPNLDKWLYTFDRRMDNLFKLLIYLTRITNGNSMSLYFHVITSTMQCFLAQILAQRLVYMR